MTLPTDIDARTCKGSTAWFIGKLTAGETTIKRRSANAIAACHTCPALEQCRTEVLAGDVDPWPWHIGAGMTPRQRAAERLRRR